MFIVNTPNFPGQEYEVLGLVKGNIVQSKNVFSDIGAGFKNMVGGEIKAYSDMLSNARAIATKRMVDEAEELGADGVINVKFASSSVMQNAAEIIAYGTAVKLK